MSEKLEVRKDYAVAHDLAHGLEPSGEEVDRLLANEPRLTHVLYALEIAGLREAGKTCAPGTVAEPLFNAVLSQLQRYVYEAAARNDCGKWREGLEALMELSADFGYRLQILRPLYAQGDYDRIVELMEPFVDTLNSHPAELSEFSSLLSIAAYRTGRSELVRKIRDERAASAVPADDADAAIVRLETLDSFGFGDLVSTTARTVFAEALREAALGLDEYSVLGALDKATTALRESDPTSSDLRLALALAGVMLEVCWGRPYRAALTLAAECLVRSDALDDARDQWSKSRLPVNGLDAFLIMAATGSLAAIEPPQLLSDRQQTRVRSGCFAESSLTAALDDFRREPSFGHALAVWSLAYEAGHFAEIVRAAPFEVDPEAPVERARALQTAPLRDADRVPVWMMFTWHKEPDRVLRKLAAYAGDARLIVSIGADARPPGLVRMTAVLFCDQLQLMIRPVVTWGGQRGWHHNLHEVMSLFHAQAEPEAWLQLVCDRTYPLKSVARLAQLTASGRLFKPHFTTKAWHVEWPDNIVNDLPAIYSGAMKEAWSTGAPTRFVELATRSPMHGTSDFRLQMGIWNYSSKALKVDWDVSSSAHDYMISPFAADNRWLSFARMQEFVDVSTESKATYARELHPVVLRWAHSVLMKHDLRTGDPWVFISRHFVDRAFAHAGFDELFTVMNMGFAPEMNFVDTIAATYDLRSEVSHHYHTVPSHAATDAFISNICVAADQLNKSFVRKTDPHRSRDLISFFAGRILEDHLGQGLHWMVAEGAFAADAADPRLGLDELLFEQLIDSLVNVRDMIGGRSVRARFERGSIVALDDERIFAKWSWADGGLTVDFTDTSFGRKLYERGGGNGRVFTLVPSELVSPHNGWSAFLDFPFDTMKPKPDAESFGSGRAVTVLSQPATWVGAATPEPALLTVFSDPYRSDIPTPTVTAEGGVFELREVDGDIVALCSLDGFPACLQIAGLAETPTRIAVHLKPVSGAVARRCCDAASAHFDGKLYREMIPGFWTLHVLEGAFELELRKDGCIVGAEGQKTGRWFLRPDGLFILGPENLRIGLANHLRLEGIRWRLSGWGWRNLKDAATFSLRQSNAAITGVLKEGIAAS